METSAKQFYIHDRFLNTYYYLYIALEKWVAKNIFREDITRVFLASDDYAFRRRFELTDMSKDYSEIDLTALRFPFANYWPQNTGWQPDRRVAATTAAMIYEGVYEGATKIRAIPSIMTMPITFYFDREDDARLAYEMLYFYSFNEHYYQQDMPYGGVTSSTTPGPEFPELEGSTLQIPISIEIKDLQFNPQFTESDWLKQQRIFVIKANMDVRSYAIHPPKQPEAGLELNSDGYLSDGSIYDDGYERYYLTDKVLLNMDPSYAKSDVVYSNVTVTGALLQSSIKVNRLGYELIDNTTVKLKWSIGEDSRKDITNIAVTVDNGITVENVDINADSYLLTGLSPGSSYRACVIFTSKDGIPKRLGLDISTIDIDKDVQLPKNSLVGFSW